jgi:hypothetical protein
MKSIILFLVAMSLGVPSWAIRHVGNGGGEAELMLQQMNSVVAVWAQACEQNQNLCWSAGVIPPEIKTALPSLQLDFSEKGASFYNGKLVLKNSDLYEADQKTPRSPEILAEIYLRSLYAGFNYRLPPDLRLGVLPLAEKNYDNSLYVFKGSETDVLVAPALVGSVHQAFVAQSQCPGYRYAGQSSDGLLVRCNNDSRLYRVFILNSSQGSVLRVLFEGED